MVRNSLFVVSLVSGALETCPSHEIAAKFLDGMMLLQPVGSSSVLYTKHQQATIQNKMIQDGEHMLAARV